MSDFIHRILLVVPVARCAALNAWIKAVIDPQGSDWLTPCLSATGAAPATHAWCCFAMDDPAGQYFLSRLAEQAEIDAPTDWDGWTRQQKKDWLAEQSPLVLSRIGVLVVGMDNDGEWTDHHAVLAEHNLQVIAPE